MLSRPSFWRLAGLLCYHPKLSCCKHKLSTEQAVYVFLLLYWEGPPWTQVVLLEHLNWRCKQDASTTATLSYSVCHWDFQLTWLVSPGPHKCSQTCRCPSRVTICQSPHIRLCLKEKVNPLPHLNGGYQNFSYPFTTNLPSNLLTFTLMSFKFSPIFIN